MGTYLDGVKVTSSSSSGTGEGYTITSKTLDLASATGTVDVFNVSGRVFIYYIFSRVVTAIVDGTSLVLGTAANLELFQTTTLTSALGAANTMIVGTPTVEAANMPVQSVTGFIDGDSDQIPILQHLDSNIILTITGTITSGSIEVYCRWKPVSAGATVVGA